MIMLVCEIWQARDVGRCMHILLPWLMSVHNGESTPTRHAVISLKNVIKHSDKLSYFQIFKISSIPKKLQKKFQKIPKKIPSGDGGTALLMQGTLPGAAALRFGRNYGGHAFRLVMAETMAPWLRAFCGSLWTIAGHRVTTKPRDIHQLASECSQIMAGVYYVVTLATWGFFPPFWCKWKPFYREKPGVSCPSRAENTPTR